MSTEKAEESTLHTLPGRAHPRRPKNDLAAWPALDHQPAVSRSFAAVYGFLRTPPPRLSLLPGQLALELDPGGGMSWRAAG
jgi:hypothetical protein